MAAARPSLRRGSRGRWVWADGCFEIVRVGAREWAIRVVPCERAARAARAIERIPPHARFGSLAEACRTLEATLQPG